MAAVCYVQQLEDAYQHAFAAIEMLASAIERVQQLRDQERIWDQAQTLGVAPKRPEPFHVRAAFLPLPRGTSALLELAFPEAVPAVPENALVYPKGARRARRQRRARRGGRAGMKPVEPTACNHIWLFIGKRPDRTLEAGLAP